MRVSPLEIAVGTEVVAGSVAAPVAGLPGILFLHGWGGSQERDLARAKKIAALGCVCLTFDFRGHAATESQRHSVTREDNLRDAIAAYDALVAQPSVDPSYIAVVGSSYGGYIAAILTAIRSVKWLAMRVPALYRDEGWLTPKEKLDRSDLARYRNSIIEPDGNRALKECRKFAGDVLVVESEHDHIVPHPAVASYTSAFISAKSLTYRVIEGADHALSDERSREAYDSLLIDWVEEMVLGAR